jgi:hypothetical protein
MLNISLQLSQFKILSLALYFHRLLFISCPQSRSVCDICSKNIYYLWKITVSLLHFSFMFQRGMYDGLGLKSFAAVCNYGAVLKVTRHEYRQRKTEGRVQIHICLLVLMRILFLVKKPKMRRMMGRAKVSLVFEDDKRLYCSVGRYHLTYLVNDTRQVTCLVWPSVSLNIGQVSEGTVRAMRWVWDWQGCVGSRCSGYSEIMNKGWRVWQRKWAKRDSDLVDSCT